MRRSIVVGNKSKVKNQAFINAYVKKLTRLNVHPKMIICFILQGIYARGPQAHLVRGVMEQSDIYHIIDYSMCLTEDARNMCKGQGISVT